MYRLIVNENLLLKGTEAVWSKHMRNASCLFKGNEMKEEFASYMLQSFQLKELLAKGYQKGGKRVISPGEETYSCISQSSKSSHVTFEIENKFKKLSKEIEGKFVRLQDLKRTSFKLMHGQDHRKNLSGN